MAKIGHLDDMNKFSGEKILFVSTKVRIDVRGKHDQGSGRNRASHKVTWSYPRTIEIATYQRMRGHGVLCNQDILIACPLLDEIAKDYSLFHYFFFLALRLTMR